MAKSLLCRCFVFPALPLFLSVLSWAQSVGKPFDNSHFDTIEGFSVHYRIWNGSLEHPVGKIFFVHGFAGSTFCFRYLYDTLASLGYKVVAVDIPGAGYSSRSLDFNHSNSHRGMFLWKLLARVDIKGGKGDEDGMRRIGACPALPDRGDDHRIGACPALPDRGDDHRGGACPARTGGRINERNSESNDHGKWFIVGHSMGGGAAEAMAILHPEWTKSLILIAGTLFRKTNNMNSTFTFMVRQKNVKKVLVAYAHNNLITYKRFYKLLKSGYGRLPDSTEVMGYLSPLETEGSAEALINIYVNNREKESLDAKTLINVPVRAIWGTKDNWVSLRTARMNFGIFPDFELVKIKGAGHMPMETHVQQFIPPFLEFLRQ